MNNWRLQSCKFDPDAPSGCNPVLEDYREPTKADFIAALEANRGLAWEVVSDLAPRLAGPWASEHNVSYRPIAGGLRHDSVAQVQRHCREWSTTVLLETISFHAATEYEARAIADLELRDRNYILAQGDNNG